MGEAEQDEREKYIIGWKSGSVLALQSQVFCFYLLFLIMNQGFWLILFFAPTYYFLDK